MSFVVFQRFGAAQQLKSFILITLFTLPAVGREEIPLRR